jgi:hypothetical protein
MRNAFAHPRLVLLLSLASLPACDGNLGSVATSESGSEGDEPTTGSDGDGDGDHDPIACIGGQLCPTGTSCSNGVCETECSNDGECDGDEYCGLDGLCHANTVPSCNSDLDCKPTQSCLNQICTALGGDGCDLDDYLHDGCPSNAVCLEDFDQPEVGFCYPMPVCAEDQSCPIGLEGAVCNTGQLPTKDEICLIGACDVMTDCPEFWSCVRYDNSVLGMCSDGGFASPCSLDAHCLSGSCVLLPGVGGGFCG